jgi:hypothetical protein
VKLPIIAALIILSTTGCAKVSSILGGGSKPMVNSEGKVIAGRNQYDRDAEIAMARSLLLIQESKERMQEKNLIATTPTKSTTLYPDGREVTNENYAILVLAAKYENQEPIAPYVAPPSETAQNIKAAGGFVREILGAPATLGLGLGYFWSNAVAAMADTPNIHGDRVTIKDSFNEPIASGDGSKVHTGGDPIPVIGEGDAEPPIETGESVYGPAPMGY